MDHKPDKSLPIDILSFAKEEREYLHDLANPLAIAAAMLEALQLDLSQSGVKLSEDQARKLAKAQAAIDRLGVLLKSRRVRMFEIQEKYTNKA